MSHFDSWSTPRITPANSLIWQGCQVQRCLETLCFPLAGRYLTERGNRRLSYCNPEVHPLIHTCCLRYTDNQPKAWKSCRKCQDKNGIFFFLAKTGIATVEKQRARGMADICCPHYCHRIAVTFGAALCARAQASWMPNQMRSNIVCVYVFVWVRGTRSKLPTASPWQNGLNVMCME